MIKYKKSHSTVEHHDQLLKPEA